MHLSRIILKDDVGVLRDGGEVRGVLCVVFDDFSCLDASRTQSLFGDKDFDNGFFGLGEVKQKIYIENK